MWSLTEVNVLKSEEWACSVSVVGPSVVTHTFYTKQQTRTHTVWLSVWGFLLNHLLAQEVQSCSSGPGHQEGNRPPHWRHAHSHLVDTMDCDSGGKLQFRCIIQTQRHRKVSESVFNTWSGICHHIHINRKVLFYWHCTIRLVSRRIQVKTMNRTCITGIMQHTDLLDKNILPLEFTTISISSRKDWKTNSLQPKLKIKSSGWITFFVIVTELCFFKGYIDLQPPSLSWFYRAGKVKPCLPLHGAETLKLDLSLNVSPRCHTHTHRTCSSLTTPVTWACCHKVMV